MNYTTTIEAICKSLNIPQELLYEKTRDKDVVFARNLFVWYQAGFGGLRVLEMACKHINRSRVNGYNSIKQIENYIITRDKYWFPYIESFLKEISKNDIKEYMRVFYPTTTTLTFERWEDHKTILILACCGGFGGLVVRICEEEPSDEDAVIFDQLMKTGMYVILPSNTQEAITLIDTYMLWENN